MTNNNTESRKSKKWRLDERRVRKLDRKDNTSRVSVLTIAAGLSFPSASSSGTAGDSEAKLRPAT